MDKQCIYGIDNNKDGHCDRCGKFVDNNGHHNIDNFGLKDIEIYKNFDIDNAIKFYNEEKNIGKLFNYIYGSLDNTNTLKQEVLIYSSYFRNYTLNNYSKYSSKTMNKFLRTGIIPEKYNALDIKKRVERMEYLINKAKLSNPIVLLEGFLLINIMII